MVSRQATIKDKCGGCGRFLSLHNKIMPCETCGMVVHAECAKFNFEFNHLSGCWQCQKCISSNDCRYNPFSNISYYDKHDPGNLDQIEDIAEISKILNDCSYYDTTQQQQNVTSLHGRWLQTVPFVVCFGRGHLHQR